MLHEDVFGITSFWPKAALHLPSVVNLLNTPLLPYLSQTSRPFLGKSLNLHTPAYIRLKQIESQGMTNQVDIEKNSPVVTVPHLL